MISDDDFVPPCESHYVNVDDGSLQPVDEPEKSFYSFDVPEAFVQHLQMTYCTRCHKQEKPPLYSTNKELHCEQCQIALRFLCIRCGPDKTYKRLKSLRSHIRRHSPVAPQFFCELCPYSTNRKASLLLHVRSIHTSVESQTKIHKCSKCDKLYKHRHHMLRHQAYCQSTEKFSCAEPGCRYSTVNPAWLSKHVQDYHSDPLPRYECTSCGKYYAHSTTLTKHYKRGCGIIVHCAFCDYSAINKQLLIEHIKFQHHETVPGWKFRSIPMSQQCKPINLNDQKGATSTTERIHQFYQTQQELRTGRMRNVAFLSLPDVTLADPLDNTASSSKTADIE
ncbi:hypothetical protein QAD02_022633 [Eretmocerus hayati]|uniref:Uncharacterized protein n=1 Tax=Eretmocerus hayati TaxID=131215 RepID=A0ACC2PW26_9HYME|nr:hypothetical protein QAD02_022633 [Eretmocerus hayati]